MDLTVTKHDKPKVYQDIKPVDLYAYVPRELIEFVLIGFPVYDDDGMTQYQLTQKGR